MVTRTPDPVTARRARGATLVFALALPLVLASTTAALAAAPRATLDQQVVHQGDPVRLTIELPDDADGGLDLSPLAADFEVLGSQQSDGIRIVNGAVERSRALELTLQPKRAGALTVPALAAGRATTAPIALTVLDAAASPPPSAAQGDRDAQPLFVEATVDQSAPFVQGEVRYTVKVYDGLGIQDGALSQPEADGVRVEPRGEPRRFEQVVDGRRYVVHERQFALIPQRSGDLTVPPVVLQARVPDERRGRGRRGIDPFFDDSLFDEMFAQMRAGGFGLGSSLIDRMLSPGREVRVRSNPVSLSVQGRPEDAPDGWFLPAREVELEQRWEPARPTFRVGETVRREVVLRARGASASQLPELAIGAADGVKQYPGESDERQAQDGSVAERVQTVELLPTRAGTFTLPAVEVRWWDVEAGAARTATLPAETIEVLPAPGGAPASAPAAAPAPAQQAAPEAAPSTPKAAPAASSVPWTPIGVAVVLAAMGGAVALWWTRRRGARAAHVPSEATPGTTHGREAAGSPRRLADAVRRACAADDPRATRAALLAWGRAVFPTSPPASASEVARRLAHPGLVHAVKQLDDALYAPHATAWRGEPLWQALREARRTVDADASDDGAPLPALYPTPRVA